MTRYIVIGAGAVGVTVAAELQAIGRDVVVVGRGQQLELLREGKLRYFRPDGDRLLHLAAAAGPQDVRLAPTDVLVLATKTQQAAAAISEWAWQPVAGTDREAGEVVPILTLQNGLDVERSALRGFATVVGSVLWTSATYTADGEVVTPSAPAAGVFWLGPYPDGPASAAAGTISADLEVAGFEVQVVEDLSRWKAAKLLSSVTFVLDALYSKSPDRDRAADLVRTEAAQILAAAGLDVADIPAESTIRFDRFSSRPIEGRSRGGNSTWQSLTRHRDIETDFLNGEIVLLARLLGRRAPLSEAFLARVHVVARHGTSPGSLPVEDLLDVLARATAPVDAEFAATGALPASDAVAMTPAGEDRRIILGAYYLYPSSHYSEVWRHPYSESDFVSVRPFARLARFLEDAGFDLAFIPESLSAPTGDDGTWSRGIEAGEIGAVRHEPSTLAQAILSATQRLAVGVTLSTTFWSPYQIARLFSSLAHLSDGRVGWNIITSTGDGNARSFGLPQMPDHDSRYEHADRVVEAAVELWDSWQPDALVLDKESGRFADGSKINDVHFESDGVKVDSVLSLPFAPGGGRPVFIQAGESEAGRNFAAKWAELVFSIQNTPANLKLLRDDVRARAVRLGRPEDSIRLLAAIIPVIGETDAIAEARSEYLRSLIRIDRAAKKLAASIGIPLPACLDEKVVNLIDDPGTLPIRTRRVLYELGVDTTTFRELSVQVAQSSSTAWVVGSPGTVADRLQEFFEGGAVDGFIITPTHFPGTFEEFGRSVVPVLRDRGLVRDALPHSDVSFRRRLSIAGNG